MGGISYVYNNNDSIFKKFHKYFHMACLSRHIVHIVRFPLSKKDLIICITCLVKYICLSQHSKLIDILYIE
jgi:hypothetical protein